MTRTGCIEKACELAKAQNRLFINGSYVDSKNIEEIASVNPSTGKVWASVQSAGKADVEDAVMAAHNCFENNWRKTSPKHREKLLRKFADLVEQNGDIICALDAMDSGRLFGDAAEGNGQTRIGTASIETLLDTIHYFAGWPTKIAGQSFPLVSQPETSQMRSMQTLLEPIGVVGCILPWNAPALFMINKVIPALAAGCTAVVKPAEQTPVSALFIASLFREAGFPSGAVNVVNGYGAVAGDALSSHPLVKKITFTGSTQVGRSIACSAANTFKRLTLELGGKSAFIVMDDADLDAAAFLARVMGYGNSGQFCMCPSRLFVEESVQDQFIEKLNCHVEDIVVGDSLAADTTMGPVITLKDRDRIANMVDIAREQGAELIFGGETLDRPGNFYKPTLLRHQDTNLSIAKEEVFGPVLLTVPFKKDDLDTLLKQANETDFGLAASLWTKDLSLARRLAEKLEAGIIAVNSHGGINPMVPFGGVKDSGIGREFGKEGFMSFLETKSLHMLV